MGEFTSILASLKDGEPRSEALNALFDSAYAELKRIAHSRLKRNQPITMLDTTALVHESYLRFLQAGKLDLEDRVHFIGYAARVMRSVIVDFVRSRSAERRGGDQVHVSFSTEHENLAAKEDDVLRLNDALTDLQAIDPNMVKIVEMRFFAGLSVEEVASALSLSPRTIAREWQKARLLLSDTIRGI
ncbi:MAG: ECF-type sigma factor [Usitatibacteraceae bacterium]